MGRAIVIDGNSLFYRVYWATIKMLDYYHKNNLLPTNAINLFIKTVYTLIKKSNYEYYFIAFDYSRKSFRTTLFNEYKSNRKPMPDEMKIQFPYILEILNRMGINNQSLQDYEADDLIGSFCQLMNNNNVSVDVYTSDKDLLQLVNDKTSVNLFKVGVSQMETYNMTNFKQKFYGLLPKQIIDYKAIVGDSSDNFIGIKGIGPKVAINLLKKYGSLANIYQNLNNISLSSKIQAKKFIDGKNDANLYYKIATIKNDLFNNETIEKFKRKQFDKNSLNEYLKQMKLFSLIKLNYFN